MPDFRVLSTHRVEEPDTNEYTQFMEWWPDYAKTLNMRATLVWQELAWAGWYARSEVADGNLPTVFERKEGE